VAIVSQQRMLVAALAAATLLAFTPSSWMAPWSGEVAAVLTSPVRPMSRVLAWARDLLRSPYDPYEGLAPDAARLAQERDLLQGELDRERMRSATLEKQLQDLRVVVDADTRGGWRPVLASVVERPSARQKRYGLDAGEASGIAEGDPVVAGGNRLVGRIAGPLQRAKAYFVPLDDGVLGRLDALVYPAQRLSNSPRNATMIQLLPIGGGRLRGELERDAPVQPGDVVLLNDATWKPAAQGMRVGIIERVGALDSNPLRTGVEVRMDPDPSRVGGVTVKVADASVPDRAPPAAPPSRGARP
jgi:cell shape-determining protein MreC